MRRHRPAERLGKRFLPVFAGLRGLFVFHLVACFFFLWPDAISSNFNFTFFLGCHSFRQYSTFSREDRAPGWTEAALCFAPTGTWFTYSA